MSTSSSASRRPHSDGDDNDVYEVTAASPPLSEDQSARMRAYTVQMIIRTACFIGAVIAEGWLRWVLFGGAMVLPYIAVVLANNTRQVQSGELSSLTDAERQLPERASESTGADDDETDGTVTGSVVGPHELEAPDAPNNADDEQNEEGHDR